MGPPKHHRDKLPITLLKNIQRGPTDPFKKKKPESCTVMDEIHPSLQRHVSLSSQHLYSIPKSFRRSLVIWHYPPPIREHRLVKVPSKIWSVIVRHFPHRPNNASESAVLDRTRKVQSLVRDAVCCVLGRVTSSKEREFGRGKPGSHDVE